MKKHLALSLLIGFSIFLTTRAKAQFPILDAQALSAQKAFTSLDKALNQPEKAYILDLGGQKLKKFPLEILKLTNLQKLILYSNGFSAIPEEIAQLKNLQYIDLYDNHLSDLPQGFTQLQNLEYLDLGDNYFREMPPELFDLPKLKDLYLYGNKLRRLHPALGKLKTLERLRLGGGFTFLSGGNHIRSLPESIGELSSLKELYLPDNCLKKLPASFGKLDSLRWLDLSNNRFRRIPASLSDLESLEYITIWDRGFSKKNKTKQEAQKPTTNFDFHDDFEGNLWGLSLGFQQGKFSVGELGIVRAFKKDIFVIATGLSTELNFNGKMSAAKASVWANGLTIFSLGLHGAYYFDDVQNNIALRPEIGVGWSLWSLNYGYNILFRKGSENINKHMLTFRLIVPIQPFFSPFK